MRKLFLLILSLLVIMPLFAKGKKDVLVVCPFPLSGTWSKNTLAPITEIDNDKQKLNIYYAVMRNSSFKDVEDFNTQEETIFEHYKSDKPDAIVIFGPGNYIIADDFQKKWKDVPMLLVGELDYVCGKEYVCDSVPRADAERVPMKEFASGKNLTFVYTPVFLQETVDLVCKLNPSVLRFLFLGGEEYLSREIELNIAQAVKAIGKEFKAYHPDDYSYRDLASLASNVDRKTSGFLYCNWHNKQGVTDKSMPNKGVRDAMERLVPLFNVYYSIIDSESYTAGYVSYEHDDYARTLQQTINDIVGKGKEPKDIPFVRIDKGDPVVNYNALANMGYDMEKLPADIKVLNTPLSFWEEYSIPALSLIILSLIGVSALFFYLYRKQKKLYAASERYYALINNAPFNYNSSRLYFKGDRLYDIRTHAVNLTLQKSANARSIDFGSESLMERYPESAPEFIRQVGKGLAEHKKTIRFTFYLKEYDCYYEVLVLLDGGDMIHTFSINTTQLMHTQKELMQAKEVAEQSDKLKTAFIQNVSHEIRTPLNAVVGFSQLLSLPDDLVSQEEKTKYAEYIENNSEMLMMLVNDILSVGDIERGRFAIFMGEANCNNVCRNAMRTVEARVPDGVELRFTTDVDDSYQITSDEKRIQQVLVNFLTNACKHTEKGEIHVNCSLSEHPGNATFSVTDTGDGVPVDMAEKIFDRFIKLDTFKQGAGLGLNICRTIADKLGGEVKLDTSYTKGARFVFLVPIKK